MLLTVDTINATTRQYLFASLQFAAMMLQSGICK